MPPGYDINRVLAQLKAVPEQRKSKQPQRKRQMKRPKSEHTPELMRKGRAGWMRGLTEEDLERKLRLRKGTIQDWREKSEPDGKAWERPGDRPPPDPEAGILMIGDEGCPTFWEWLKTAQPKIDSKDRGKIPFQPWPGAQTALIEARLAGGVNYVVDKSRQTGATTAIGLTDSYLLLHAVPYHCDYVSKDEAEGLKLIAIVKLALESAQLTPGQRKHLILGT